MLYITGVYAVGPDIASALQVPVRLCVNKCLALCSVSSAMMISACINVACDCSVMVLFVMVTE